MTVPEFRYQPRIQELLERIPEVAQGDAHGPIAQMVEELYRRDRQLEDWLKNFGGGREYATVVVAAADTHRAGKSKANFVCDGSGDQAAFNLAIDSLPTVAGVKMGRIVALEGTYIFSGPVIWSSATLAYVDFVGMAPSAAGNTSSSALGFGTIIVPDSSFPAGSALFDAVNATAGFYNQFSVESLVIGYPLNGAVSNVVAARALSVISQCALFGGAGSGRGAIDIYSAPHIITDSVVTAGSGNPAVYSSAGASINTILSVKDSLLTTAGGAPVVSLSAVGPPSIVNSTLTQADTAQPTVSITLAAAGTGGVIQGNTFRGAAKNYIVLTAFAGAQWQGLNLTGNTLGVPEESSCLQHAALLTDLADSSVIGNRFAGLSSSSSGTYDQLFLESAGQGCDRNVIIGNSFEGTATGRNQAYNVRVDDAASGGNIIHSNHLGGGTLGTVSDAGTSTVTTIPASTVPPTITVRKNTGADIGTRRRLNFIEGTNVTITASDDSGSDEIDVTLAAATALAVRKNSGSNVGTRPRINFIEGSNITLTVADDGVDSEVDVTITGTAAGIPTDIQTFAANGTWTKPSGGQTRARVIIIGGGGGSGSGRRGVTGTARGGGGPGGGGGYVELDIPLSALSATQAVVAGAVGTGGAGVTADSTNGNAGTAGTASSFAGYSGGGGGAGGGGTTSVGTSGSAGSGLHAAPSGGAGGGIDASDNLTSSAAGTTSSWGKAGGAGG